MASSRSALPVATLVLRVPVLLFLVASVAIIATAKVRVDPASFAFDQLVNPPNLTFQDFNAYRYVLAAGVIGCVYTLLAMAFVAINVAGRRKMVGGSEGGTVFLICADVVCAVLVATGAAAGLGLTVESQRFEELLDSAVRKFYDRVDLSCAALLVATVCMVAIITISAHSLTK